MHKAASRMCWMRRTYPVQWVDMEAKFDIFKQLGDGTSIWIVAVDGLEEAKKRINRLEAVERGDYLVYSEERGLVVERVSNAPECYSSARR